MPHTVVRKDIKYIYYPEHEYEVVYDLRNDPHEKVSVATSPAYTKKVKNLRRSYRILKQSVK